MKVQNGIGVCWFFILIITLLLGGYSFAQEEEEEEEPMVGERPSLQASELSSAFRFDGYLYESVWTNAADSISNLIVVEPEEGGEPEGRTVVKVFVDRFDILVAVRCYDDNPKGIVAFSKARDAELEEEDNITLVFDTFLDARSGYYFQVNPSGARVDGLVEPHSDEPNIDWDTIWEAKTSRDDNGWSAEIRIPIKSLSFKKGLSEWGFNVQRRVQRLQEVSRWSGASQDYDIIQVSRAGLLTDLPEDFDYGIGLSVRPSLVGRLGKVGSDSTYTEGDISLDVTQRLGPNLTAALTVNTDFAETEVDVRQINLTRFPVFFPEKRTFFLQGSDIFEFGAGLDEDNIIPFFSRRIGLLGLDIEDQPEIPINVGGKINGRVGNTNLGALVVNTRKVDSLDIGDVDEDIKIHVPQSTMGAVRINQNILEESSIGVIGTFGDQLGRKDSWSAGADLTFRTSNFLNEKNFQVGVWGLFNDREDLDSLSGKSAYGVTINYPNDLIDLNFKSIHIGEGFDPSLSFVPRNNIHIWQFGGEYNPRPSWTLVRQMFHELSGVLYNNTDNSDWESYEATVKPLDWLLESGDSFNGGITPQGDRPPEAFELASDVDIPAGSYEWTRYFLEVRAAEKRIFSGNILWEFGDYYNGDLSTLEGRIAFKPSALLTLELTGERNDGKAMALPEDFDPEEEDSLIVVEKKYLEQLFGVRIQINFSPNLQFSSLTQYDTESRELGTNNRLRWTFHPLGDIFIVYNHNVVRRREDDRWEFVSNELPIKIQYTWRF
jgi:hypothetical protein